MHPKQEQADIVAALEAQISDLKAVLKQDDYAIQVAFRLTPSLSNIFGLLLAVPLVTADMIHQRLGIAADAKVSIHRLRQALKPWDVAIQSRRNLGYWIEPPVKERVKGLITSAVTAHKDAIKAPVAGNAQE